MTLLETIQKCHISFLISGMKNGINLIKRWYVSVLYHLFEPCHMHTQYLFCMS